MNSLETSDGNRRILLFVRCPEKGRVKTRLESHLSQDKILGLYRCFVEDSLAFIQKSGYPVCIYFHPEAMKEQMKTWLDSEAMYAPQTGNDLGQRMGNAFEQTFKAPSPVDQAVLIGSDFPDLDPGILDEAFDSLSTNDLTLGPAIDGGYYLIGFNRHAFFTEIFHCISWGTRQVFEQTIEKIEQAGKRVQMLPKWRDIDTFKDLKQFYRDAKENGRYDLKTVHYLSTIMKDS